MYSVLLGQNLYIPVLSVCMDSSPKYRGRVVTAEFLFGRTEKEMVGETQALALSL